MVDANEAWGAKKAVVKVTAMRDAGFDLTWVAAEWGVPISLRNTFLEVGALLALALPEVRWLECSFQNFDHLVEQTLVIRDGLVEIPEAPGHGLSLSETARNSARDLLS